jgi:hypothetical protein
MERQDALQLNAFWRRRRQKAKSALQRHNTIHIPRNAPANATSFRPRSHEAAIAALAAGNRTDAVRTAASGAHHAVMLHRVTEWSWTPGGRCKTAAWRLLKVHFQHHDPLLLQSTCKRQSHRLMPFWNSFLDAQRRRGCGENRRLTAVGSKLSNGKGNAHVPAVKFDMSPSDTARNAHIKASANLL